jgi:hypothetical protein
MGLRGLPLAGILLAACAPRDTLERRLWELPHTYRRNWDCSENDRGPPYDERHMAVRALTPEARTKAIRLLDELQKPAFRQAIGKALEEDVKDTATEHGGVIITEGSSLRLQPHYPTTFSAYEPNSSYHAPLTRHLAIRKPDYFAHYHFHAAQDDNPDVAGPSPGDLGSLKQDLWIREDICGVVITKLAGRTFNIDLYLDPAVVELHGHYFADGTVTDLGTYRY